MKLPFWGVLAAGAFASTSLCLLASCAATSAQNGPMSSVANTAPSPLTTVATPKGALPRALWVWDATVITDPKHAQELFAFCAQKNLSRIYLSVGDVFSPNQRAAADPKHVTAPLLSHFLGAAHAKKIEVEALDGDPDFALQINHAQALGILQKALAFNKTAALSEKLDGFQWDTEPYILDAFKAGGQSQRDVLKQYLDGVAELRDAVKTSPDLRLGFAIPGFFDDKERTIEWNGATKPVAFHLLDTLNALPSSYIVIMAYRDHALGPNGTVEVSRGEIEYATQHARAVKVWIGQETLDPTGDPPSISFFHVGENGLEQALGQIQKAFQNQPALQGLAIHHWQSYRVLKAGKPLAPVVVSAPITKTLTILTPHADAPVARRVEVTGTAKPGGQGTKVEVSVRPAGDIWYPQGEVPVSPEGTWSVTSNFGNEQTPAASGFEVRAQLKRADGSVVTEQIVKVKTG